MNHYYIIIILTWCMNNQYAGIVIEKGYSYYFCLCEPLDRMFSYSACDQLLAILVAFIY